MAVSTTIMAFLLMGLMALIDSFYDVPGEAAKHRKR
jgi:hypothetical protein